jgi:hypothetical protein
MRSMAKPRLAKTSFERKAGIWDGGIGKSKGGIKTARLKARRALRKARERIVGTKEITLKHDEIPGDIMEPLQQKAWAVYQERGVKAMGNMILVIGVGAGVVLKDPGNKAMGILLSGLGMTLAQKLTGGMRRIQAKTDYVTSLNAAQPRRPKTIRETARKYPFLVAKVTRDRHTKPDRKKPWNVFRVEEITFTNNPGIGKRKRTTKLWAT